MQLNTQDYLKKALVDTQERVRDFMMYSEKAKDRDIQSFSGNTRNRKRIRRRRCSNISTIHNRDMALKYPRPQPSGCDRGFNL